MGAPKSSFPLPYSDGQVLHPLRPEYPLLCPNGGGGGGGGGKGLPQPLSVRLSVPPHPISSAAFS